MAMKIAGRTVSISRGIARSARPATVAMSRSSPAGRGCRSVRVSGVSATGLVAVMIAPRSRRIASCSMRLPGQLEEHVVERWRAQREVTHRHLAVGEGDGDRADRRRAGVGGDDQLVAVDLDLLHAVDRPHGVGDARRIAVEPGDDDVGADGALEVGGRALGDDLAVVDDADAVGERVGLLEVLGGEEDRHAQLVVEPAHLVPARVPGSPGRARWSVRRGTGCRGCGRGRRRGRGGASSLPSRCRCGGPSRR